MSSAELTEIEVLPANSILFTQKGRAMCVYHRPHPFRSLSNAFIDQHDTKRNQIRHRAERFDALSNAVRMHFLTPTMEKEPAHTFVDKCSEIQAECYHRDIGYSAFITLSPKRSTIDLP